MRPHGKDEHVTGPSGRGRAWAAFMLRAPDAIAVEVVGNFAYGRQVRVPLSKDVDGAWRTSFQLSEGWYEYWFEVDGQRVRDPENTRDPGIAADGNASLLHVKAS